MKKIVPLFKNVLVKPVKYIAPDATASVGGILVPEVGAFDSVKLGEVVKIGEDVEITLDIGNLVILPEWGGTKFNYEGDNCCIYDVEDLLGVLKESGDI